MSNVLIAAGLFAGGVNETKRHYPHANPTPQYIPLPQVVSYCMNFPPFVFRNLAVNFVIRKSPVVSALWYKCFESPRYHEGADYYFLVFLLWWWIGWRLDIRSKARSSPRRSLAILGNTLGVLLSLTLLYVAADQLNEVYKLTFAGGLAMPVSTLVWGLALFCYFGQRLLMESRSYPPSRELI